jgi:polysaccharide biosynthesis protein PslF
VKVLVISAAFPPMPAGEADHAFHLCEHLAARGLDIHVLTTKENAAAGSFPFAVYPLIQNWSWPDLLSLARFIRRCSPDAILLMYSGWIYNDHPMITFVPVLAKILIPHIPFVTQFEIDYFSFQASFLTQTTLKVIRHCIGPEKIDSVLGTLFSASDRIIVLSERHQTQFAQRFPGIHGKSIVIPPPSLLHMSPANNEALRRRSREAFGVRPGDFLIAHFGYLYPSKGVETLFKALQMTNNRRRNVRLLMVGGGKKAALNRSYIQELETLAKRLEIDDKIIWTGEYAWDSDEASRYLRLADACVLPFTEGVSLNRSSFAAAVAHGLPTVTTKGKLLESPFIDRKNVLLCPPNDPESLADTLDHLIDSPELRQQLRAGALELTREWFCWDKVVERTVGTLKMAKKKGNRSGGMLKRAGKSRAKNT